MNARETGRGGESRTATRRNAWYWRGWEAGDRAAGESAYIYRGEYYDLDLDRQGYLRLKLTYLAATLAMYGVYLWVQLTPAGGERVIYSGAPALLAMLPMMYHGMGVFWLLVQKRPMTYRTYYAAFERIRYASNIQLPLLTLATLGQIVFICIGSTGANGLGPELRRLAGCALCTALAGGMFALRRRFAPEMVQHKR